MKADEIERSLRKALDRLKTKDEFRQVNFIILYGSALEGNTRDESDIDLCIDIDAGTNIERSKFRLKVLSELPDFFDVHIFSQLPLYIRKEVIKGKVILCKNEEKLYEKALDTIKDFDYFKYRFYDYIGEKAIT